MKQIFIALDYVHKQNYIHRDLKPSNVIVNSDSMEVKIIDFGLAIRSDKDNEDQRCGTVLYQAPE